MEAIEEISVNDVKKILNTAKITNRRFNKEQFEKLYDDGLNWYCLFNNNTPMAIAAIRPDIRDSNYINDIQALIPGGSGKKLINWLVKNLNNVWLLADPDSDENLKNYYRQFGFTEFEMPADKNVFGKPVSFFLSKDDDTLKSWIAYFYANGENQAAYYSKINENWFIF